jgi:pimeloyl-ACP methyl ester carboxylesterase
VEIATYRLGGEGPPLLLLHATGFHGRCLAPLAAELTPAWSVWAIDIRGHGASGPAVDGRYDDWTRCADDVLAVIDALGVGGRVTGFGHSIGGALALSSEQRRPGTWLGLYCYEPVVMNEEVEAAMAAGNPLRQAALKRRDTFPSRAAARGNYASKPPFARFAPAALDAYVAHGLVDRPDGTVTLACRREVEASFYDGSTRHPTYRFLGQVAVPVTLAGGSDGAQLSGSHLHDLAGRLPHGGVEIFDGLSHFGPLEDPKRVGRAVAAAFGA